MPAQDTSKPVRNVKQGPQAVADNGGVLEGAVVLIDVLANDLASNANELWSLDQTDPGVYTAAGNTITLASGATVQFSGGQVLYSAGSAFDYLNLGEHATDTFTYSIRMANGSVSYNTVTVDVTGTNSPPDAVDDTLNAADEGTTVLAVLANDTDPNPGDVLTVTSVTQPSEGSVSVDGSGNVVFDPGTLFSVLSAGETATVSFSYTISDGHGGTDTATATVNVQGAGLFTSPLISDTAGGTLTNGQNVNITITGPELTNSDEGAVSINVGLGLVAQPILNVVYVVDVSGSTTSPFGGTSVGNQNPAQDGFFNSVLDAEIAGLKNLTTAIQNLGFPASNVTITIIPFNRTADPALENNPSASNIATTFASNDTAGITAYLSNLDALELTNYEAALQATISKLTLLDPAHTENNYVYFLSDGAPTAPIANSAAPYLDEVAILHNTFNAQVSAIGVGTSAPLTFLNPIDNTGGAQQVTSASALDASLLGSPIPSGSVIDFELLVDGVAIPGIDETDLIANVLGLTLNTTVDELDPYIGEQTTLTANITFTGGILLSAEIDITGVMPLSTNFI